MKITTLDRTVADVLKEFMFVPRFQRPYSWEKEQVEQFWEDTVRENKSDYFIGSIVIFRQGNEFGIVDGQQRITTLVLTLLRATECIRGQRPAGTRGGAPRHHREEGRRCQEALRPPDRDFLPVFPGQDPALR
jgi:uncharacterized protein DUF262